MFAEGNLIRISVRLMISSHGSFCSFAALSYGGNLVSSLQTLWKDGGISRLYQGLPFALIQGPLTRFGGTAANVGILALLEATPETQNLPLPLKTALGSVSAGIWRIFLMPIDTSKTAMQVEGAEGLNNLWGIVGKEGPSVLYNGGRRFSCCYCSRSLSMVPHLQRVGRSAAVGFGF